MVTHDMFDARFCPREGREIKGHYVKNYLVQGVRFCPREGREIKGLGEVVS